MVPETGVDEARCFRGERKTAASRGAPLRRESASRDGGISLEVPARVADSSYVRRGISWTRKLPSSELSGNESVFAKPLSPQSLHRCVVNPPLSDPTKVLGAIYMQAGQYKNTTCRTAAAGLNAAQNRGVAEGLLKRPSNAGAEKMGAWNIDSSSAESVVGILSAGRRPCLDTIGWLYAVAAGLGA